MSSIRIRIRRTRPRNESGAAAVEMALVMSILFTLVFGIIQFGQFFSQYQVFQAAAREGARVAATREINGAPVGLTTVTSRVQAAAQPYAGSLPGTISMSTVCTDANTGDPVEVSWQQPFQLSLPLVPEINVTRKISGVFRCE